MAARTGTGNSLAVQLIEARTGEPFAAVVGKRRQEGQTYRQIAAEFGVNAMTIWRHYREKGSAEHAGAD